MSYILGYKPEQFNELLRLLEDSNVSGVIFFKRNILSIKQLKNELRLIKSLRPDINCCIDFEGGRVNRFYHLNKYCESAYLLGTLFDNAASDRARQSVLYRYRSQLEPIARLFSDIGIDTVFGPCIDLFGRSPVISGFHRAYSQKKETVRCLAGTFIEVFHECGINCVIKHYPSHSMAYGDTHTQCCIDTRRKIDLKIELDLYDDFLKNYIGLGVMLSHCIFNKFCSHPVSISKYWHNSLKPLSNNLIYTDCLDMEGVSRYLTPAFLSSLTCHKIFSRLDGYFAKLSDASQLEYNYQKHGI